MKKITKNYIVEAIRMRWDSEWLAKQFARDYYYVFAKNDILDLLNCIDQQNKQLEKLTKKKE